MLAMLQRRSGSFAASTTGAPPPTLGVVHEIHLMDGKGHPIKQTAYRTVGEKKAFIDKQVALLLENHCIRLSNSPWSSPIVIVYKSDGSPRMCIDYRRLNAVTIKDAYPMPLIEDCLAMCKDADFLSIIDVQDAYYHILMDETAKAMTAFCTSNGLYEWNVMPFGLSNAPATFQRHVDTVLRPLIGKTCVAFFDDIVIFTKGTFEQHVKDVEEALILLGNAKLSAKVKKCKFGYKQIIFVGHLIKDGKLHPDPSKLRAVDEFPRPHDLTSLKSFIGLCNYYRRFIKMFVRIASPLYGLMKADVPFVWSPECESAFVDLKAALCSAECLRAPDYALDFSLSTDASKKGIGG